MVVGYSSAILLPKMVYHELNKCLHVYTSNNIAAFFFFFNSFFFFFSVHFRVLLDALYAFWKKSPVGLNGF